MEPDNKTTSNPDEAWPNWDEDEPYKHVATQIDQQMIFNRLPLTDAQRKRVFELLLKEKSKKD